MKFINFASSPISTIPILFNFFVMSIFLGPPQLFSLSNYNDTINCVYLISGTGIITSLPIALKICLPFFIYLVVASIRPPQQLSNLPVMEKLTAKKILYGSVVVPPTSQPMTTSPSNTSVTKVGKFDSLNFASENVPNCIYLGPETHIQERNWAGT